jgi:tripartite ATP-independent transporter DctM subunit
MAIPLFITSGIVMSKGKLGDALIDFVNLFVGRARAALAIVTTVACAVFGAVCGSAMATLTAIGSILAPRMIKQGYKPEIAATIVCCAAPLGMLIPPGLTQIMIAWIGSLSVLACFFSTVIPGIILTILLCIGNRIMMKKQPMPEAESCVQADSAYIEKTWIRKALPVTRHAVPAMLLPIIITGGIYSGAMTATESAGVSLLYAILICVFVYKGMGAKELKDTLVESGQSIGAIMVMMTCMVFFSRILVDERVPQQIINAFLAVSDNKYVILLMVNLFLLIIGMLMDDSCGVLLCTTLLLPLMIKIGVSPYQFAAILGVNLGYGAITPPVAPFIYVSAQITKCNPVKMMKPILFLSVFAYLPVILATTYIPWLSLALPTWLGLIN